MHLKRDTIFNFHQQENERRMLRQRLEECGLHFDETLSRVLVRRSDNTQAEFELDEVRNMLLASPTVSSLICSRGIERKYAE